LATKQELVNEQGPLVNPNFDAEEEGLPLKDTQHLHKASKVWWGVAG
jgi:hypothetical protein